MALDFPSPASPGQIYSYGIYTWEYNGTYWKSISTNSFLSLSGGTVTGDTSFTAVLFVSSISATTYENLPVSAVTNGGGISISGPTNGVVTVTNTDLGSSQNIFKNILINGNPQFSAGSNNSNLNFSGVNITITSAATNTLVFSAGTGGGSGTISGTINYIPKFTSSSSIGNSSITNIGNTVYITGLTSDDSALVVNKSGKGYVGEFRCIGSNVNMAAVAGFTDIGTGHYGIYGEAKGYSGQYGVLGSNVGSGSSIVAIRGVAVNNVNSVSTVIGGLFQAQVDTNVSAYSVQLSDGTEGLNKVLISKTSDGKANWSDTLTGLTTINVSTISATTYQNIPTASTIVSGVITTGTQTIAGNKTINGNLTVTGTTTSSSITVNGNLNVTGTTTLTQLSASQLVATDASDNLVSLSTTTYPSLTELSYVKGVTSAIQTQIDGKQATLTNGYGISGTTTKQVSLTSTQVFATATTTVNTATYLDIAGCSVTLAAGTWLITGHVVIAAANQITQGFVAITDGSNVVVAASALSRPASGTASLNSPFAVSWSVLVSPAASTTYKLRAARGLTTHTLSYTVYNGTGFNTAQHATDNSNLGTNILAIRIS